MNQNYTIIKNQIKKFCFEKLKNNQEPLERFEKLVNSNTTMIENAVKPELISGAIIYSYLREYKLNGRGGITTKELAEYFKVKPQAITSKVFDVDCIVNRSAIFPEDEIEYEFIDIDRYEINEEYFDFLESSDADDFKKSEKILLSFIKKDPYFFDPYNVLHEYYLEQDQISKAFNIMAKGYEKAMEMILDNNGNFPTSMSWLYIENRHIIRLLYDFACMMWTNGDTENALTILRPLLKSNPTDNIGARYVIAAILDKIPSFYHFSEMFDDGTGYLNWEDQEQWFIKVATKHKKEFGWWFKEVEEF